MFNRIQRPTFFAALTIAAAGILAGGSSLRAAVARAQEPTPFNSVSCSKTTACQTYKNSNTGPGLEGDNTSQSSAATAGLLGTSNGPAAGVKGTNSSTSVSAAGVLGVSTSGASAVAGTSSGPGYAVIANATGTGIAVGAQAVSGDGVAGVSQSGFGVFASSGGAVALVSEATNASGFGLLSITPSGGNTYPLVARDASGNNLFYVDGLGDVFYHGTLGHFLNTNAGAVAESYTPTAASPTIEDDGTARLVNGVATVALNPAFAHSIDPHHVYHVMLTPDGDTRGLYTATKTPTSFIVREVQGGHATLDFDYHIYAPSLGQAGVRMREMTRAQSTASGPKAMPIPQPSIMRPPGMI